MSKKGELEKETKPCGACHEDLTITSYSKKQWQLKLQRRCKKCIELDNAIKEMDVNDKQSANKSKKKGGSRTKAKNNNIIGSIPRPHLSVASEISNATERSGIQPAPPPPPPSMEMIREMKKIMTDPKQFAMILNNKQNMEDMYRANPEYARAVANNPIMQMFDRDSITEEEMEMMIKMMQEMSDEEALAMFDNDFAVAEKKVSMEATKLTDGAACWVCLDDGNDDEGNPLLRDCSCRGNSGFAHLSCLKKYAKSKGMEPLSSKFIQHWAECPHCLQDYQGDLSVAMADACLAYFENAHAMYKTIEFSKQGKAHMTMNNMTRCMITWNKFMALETLGVTNPKRISEACLVGEEMILLFDQNREWNKTDAHLRSCKVSTPTLSMEIDTCQHLARLYSMLRSSENNKKVIKYSERAISAAKEKGDDDMVKQIGYALEIEKARGNRKHEGIREESEFAHAEVQLPWRREAYTKVVNSQGENCVDAMLQGKNLVLALQKAGYSIESQRLLNKLVASSNLVFGPDHPETKGLSLYVEQAKWRMVLIENLFNKNARPIQMRVTGYADEFGEQYILTDVNKKDPPSKTVDCGSELLWIQPGTPVVCKGLVSAAHLNGKIGDIRRRDKKTNRYAVHFADQSLEPKSILARNLRILINVPDENESNDDSYIVVKK